MVTLESEKLSIHSISGTPIKTCTALLSLEVTTALAERKRGGIDKRTERTSKSFSSEYSARKKVSILIDGGASAYGYSFAYLLCHPLFD